MLESPTTISLKEDGYRNNTDDSNILRRIIQNAFRQISPLKEKINDKNELQKLKYLKKLYPNT